MDLAFEDAELVAEGENLDLERGFGLPAEDKEVEQGADDVEAIIAGRITGTIHILERHTQVVGAARSQRRSADQKITTTARWGL